MEKNAGRVKKFVEDNDITFPVLIDGKDVFKQFKVGGIPDTYCLDKRGIVRFRTVGFRPDNEKKIELAVSKFVK